jgi:hypothetical protein
MGKSDKKSKKPSLAEDSGVDAGAARTDEKKQRKSEASAPPVIPDRSAAEIAKEKEDLELAERLAEAEAERLHRAQQYGALLDAMKRVKCPLLTCLVKSFNIVTSPDMLAAPTYAAFVKQPSQRLVVSPGIDAAASSSLLGVPSAKSPEAPHRKSVMSVASRLSVHATEEDASCPTTPRPDGPLPPYGNLMCAFAATKRKPPKPKKKAVEVEPEPEPEPYRPRMTAEEAQRMIEEHTKAVSEIRKTQAEKDKQKLEREVKRAAKLADEMRQREENVRRAREEKLRKNLEALRQKREARELEHEISEQRVKKILSAQSANDMILAKEMQLEREEEERRQQALAAKRQRMDHVVTDLTKVRELIRNAEERQKLRALEIREHILETERQRPVFYQGTTYERALEEFTKVRHGPEDDKHQRLYKAAKMQEYGKLVSQLAKISVDTSDGEEERKERPPRQHHRHQDPPPNPTTTVLNALSPVDRAKIGNNYLKEGFVDKSPLPPGLKLQPLLKPEAAEIKESNEKNKARTQLGLDYLREARRIGQQFNNSPQRKDQKMLDKSEVMKEVKEMRMRTNLVERRIVYGTDMDPSQQRSRSAMDDAPDGPFQQDASVGRARILPMKRGTGAATPTPAGGQSPRVGGDDPSYVEVVNAKIAMLKKLEMLRRKSMGPQHLVKW